MVNIIKEALDVYIYNIIEAVYLCQLVAHCYCMACTSVRSKSITSVIKFGFTDWFHYLKDALLNNSVYNCWDT